MAAELGDNIHGHVCKLKWQSLRVQFKTNLAKAQKQKSGESTSEVHWRFFKAMQFIAISDESNGTLSTSHLHIVSISLFVHRSIFSVYYVPYLQTNYSTPAMESEMSSEDARSSKLDQPRKRTEDRSIKTPSLVQSTNYGLDDIAHRAMQLMIRKDEHSAFVEHIGAELRSLPYDSAQLLKRRLTRSLLDFWEEIAVSII